MNINSLTIKAQELLQAAVALAAKQGQQAVEPLHIIKAIIDEQEGIGNYLLAKVGVNTNQLKNQIDQQIKMLPKVQGGQPYLSNDTTAAIQKALDSTKLFNDKYISQQVLSTVSKSTP